MRERERERGGSQPVSNKDERFFKNLVQTSVFLVGILLETMSQLEREGGGDGSYTDREYNINE